MHVAPSRGREQLARYATRAVIVLVAMAMPAVTRAGVPFINLEGVGGVAFNPIAYPAADAKTGFELGPIELAKPRVGTWYVNLTDSKIDWTTAGIATAINKRVELSYGFENVGIQGAANVHKHNIGAKVKILDENAFDTVFVPAVAVGGVWKHTSLHKSSDATNQIPHGTNEGIDAYLVVTKLITQLPIAVLVSGGVLMTKARVDGITGFDDAGYKVVGFGNLDLIPVGWLAVGVEVKQGPSYSGTDNGVAYEYKDALYYNVHAGYLANENLTIAVAYTHAGAKKADPVGFGGGVVLGMQYAF